jgi:hypothetical protein
MIGGVLSDYYPVMAGRTALKACLAVLIATWASYATALDRVGAIGVAKRQVGSKCSPVTPCTFTAKTENNKWYVRVEFTKRNSPQDKPLPYPGGHAIFIMDQSGRVVGKIEGE